MRFTTYCRSILFTPALAVERFARGQQSGADMSLVDLEDSVAAPFKDAARAKAEAFFTAPRTASGSGRRAVRINSITRPEGLRDLLAIRDYAVKPDVIMLPKTESPRDLEIVEQVLGSQGAQVDLLALVETARGIENVDAISRATPRLKGFVFGSADFSFNIGASLSWEPLYYARARLVTAARAANLHVIDSPFFDIPNVEELRREVSLARNMGFSGKVAIHPGQIEVIQPGFSPDERMLAKARKILAESQAKDFNIAVVDGTMMGTPFIEAARRMLEEFGNREG
ncbi:MAG TPA: aldolase/citrate lyase family protein [Archangium sp.]|uniref:HpcH/HpaI aldolase/citrate lyase family protein n=1 Tax=Archangium sp. TaxID=1872627 RepID=UPI002E334D80|nr:aldolase/citrate lyase family protein [Archangium sp.]HEX5745880.1 aldolase/citrate lyase family protein [Archangium sp.]